MDRPSHCKWTQDADGPWDTACGHRFEFNNDELIDENSDIWHCMYCGKLLDVWPFEPSPRQGVSEP
jgi:hypothetical protein